jgi:hypothetical protein
LDVGNPDTGFLVGSMTVVSGRITGEGKPLAVILSGSGGRDDRWLSSIGAKSGVGVGHVRSVRGLGMEGGSGKGNVLGVELLLQEGVIVFRHDGIAKKNIAIETRAR